MSSNSRGPFSFFNLELSLLIACVGTAYWVGANQKRIQSLLQHHLPGLFVTGKQVSSSISAASLLDTAESIVQATRNENPMGSCVLATVDTTDPPNAAKPCARPINPMLISLRPQQPETPKVVFFTNRRTRKHRQLQSSPHVQLVFFDAKGAGYVNLIGEVQELPPERAAQDFWVPRMSHFLSEGPKEGTEGRFTVYQLLPKRVELMSFTRGLSTVHRQDWKPFALVWDDESNTWVLENEP